MSLNLLLTPNNLGPFYIDTLTVNNLIIPGTETYTATTAATGAYIGGSFIISATKNKGWVTLSITEAIDVAVTTVGQVLFLTSTLPAKYCPSVGGGLNVNYPAIIVNGGLFAAGRVTIKADGHLEIAPLDNLGFAAGLAGMRSFSCQYITTL